MLHKPRKMLQNKFLCILISAIDCFFSFIHFHYRKLILSKPENLNIYKLKGPFISRLELQGYCLLLVWKRRFYSCSAKLIETEHFNRAVGFWDDTSGFPNISDLIAEKKT